VVSSEKKTNNLQEEGKSNDGLSNESTSDNESQDDEAYYGSDDFDINDYANDEFKDEKDEGGLLHVPDDINKLLPCPL
jgi:hypothetical protein